jgi:hypothetical protein
MIYLEKLTQARNELIALESSFSPNHGLCFISTFPCSFTQAIHRESHVTMASCSLHCRCLKQRLITKGLVVMPKSTELRNDDIADAVKGQSDAARIGICIMHVGVASIAPRTISSLSSPNLAPGRG